MLPNATEALRLAAAPALYAAIVLLCAATTGARGRPLAPVLAGLGLLAPWAIPPVPIARATLGLLAFGVLARTVDLLAGPPVPVGRRLWHLVGVVDTRRVRSAEPSLDTGALARVAGFGILTLLGLGASVLASRLDGPGAWLVRWLGGTACVYGLVDTGFATVRIYYSLLGARVPILHRDPVLSRTVNEFWGKRWNRVIGGWLYERCYVPLAARRHPVLGVWAAFGVSALLHVHFALAGGGVAAGALMAAYFLTQGGLVLLERALRVSRWRAVPARAWTVAWMLLTAPLFVESFLRLLPVPAPGGWVTP